MGLKEEVLEMKKEVKEVKEQSLAMELLRDYRNVNKRLFVITLVILIMWFATIGYLVYVLNDIEVEEITEDVTTTTETTHNQDIKDIGSMDDSYIINGGYDYGED